MYVAREGNKTGESLNRVKQDMSSTQAMTLTEPQSTVPMIDALRLQQLASLQLAQDLSPPGRSGANTRRVVRMGICGPWRVDHRKVTTKVARLGHLDIETQERWDHDEKFIVVVD